MIRRLFYLTVGIVVGGYAVHRVDRARRALSPDGIAQRIDGRVTEYRGALRELNEDLAHEVRAQEQELLRKYEPRRRSLPES